MADIVKNIRIATPIDKVWDALTNPASIRGWMGDDDTIAVELRAGGHFQFFGGETTGVFIEIEKPNKLAYTWRQGEWQENWPNSLVSWELTPVGQETQVKLTHSQLPNSAERDSHDEGWDIYFLGPMKNWLESQT